MMVGGSAIDRLRALMARRSEHIPIGITWSVLFIVDAIIIGGGLIATLQRPVSDLPVAALAFVIAIAPPVVFAVSDIGFSPTALWAAWSTTTALMLFATSTPVHADFAPTLLVLMVGAVGALASPLAVALGASGGMNEREWVSTTPSSCGITTLTRAAVRTHNPTISAALRAVRPAIPRLRQAGALLVAVGSLCLWSIVDAMNRR